jgi:hypothetical protein
MAAEEMQGEWPAGIGKGNGEPWMAGVTANRE